MASLTPPLPYVRCQGHLPAILSRKAPAGVLDLMLAGSALRRTFASLLLGNGESPAYEKDQMGHSSIRITVDTYWHLIP